MLGPSRRSFITAAIAVSAIFGLWLNLDHVQNTSLGSKITSVIPTRKSSHLPAPIQNYFEQVFALDKPSPYPFPAIKYHCDHAPHRPELDDVYLKCVHMFAGLTSIMSQVKVCLKMALETGTNILLPSMPLRDSKNLKEFNSLNSDAHLTYDQWFDAQHLIEGLQRACPRIKVLHPNQLGEGKTPVKHDWKIDIRHADGYQQYHSYFWSGRPFKRFFDDEFTILQTTSDSSTPGSGVTTIEIGSMFLMFRITDDPTGRDLKLWNEFSLLIRFLETPRKITNQLLARMDRPFYGVHFRVENDTIWSSLEHQLKLDLDALDRAWEMFGQSHGLGPATSKPLVYLACGDSQQVLKFVEAGKVRGWDVTHKWELARADPSGETLTMIDELPFDFQGAVDMGVMVQSHFFIGITGSAFSSSTANARDVTGRYRGSSFTDFDDQGARNHLFNDGDAESYACCL
ncbi:hypothetical protein B0O99DRAFT_607923 [Bisporella sp. PMI_857]|nr:hypothetical protein B0O99DRAFT_607923 [Bisporella sp. PMI_857]